MPDLDKSLSAAIAQPGCDLLIRKAAVIIAMPLWLAACSAIENSLPSIAETGPTAVAEASLPFVADTPPGPIPLAPSITGTPFLAPALLPAPAPAVATSAPAP